MGDLSAEPSMEEILSSIKRIIAEEGDQPARRARPARAAPASIAVAPPPLDDDPAEEVLELSEPMPQPSRPDPVRPPEPRRVAEPAAAAPEPSRAPEPPRGDDRRAPEPIVGQEAAAASRGSLEALSRLLTRPEPGSDGTLEGLVREMLRPMLRTWLDTNLPAMVEDLVGREIARITGQPR